MKDYLSPENHINKMTDETLRLITNMNVAFSCMNEELLRELMVPMICPRLKYEAVVWSPHMKRYTAFYTDA